MVTKKKKKRKRKNSFVSGVSPLSMAHRGSLRKLETWEPSDASPQTVLRDRSMSASVVALLPEALRRRSPARLSRMSLAVVEASPALAKADDVMNAFLGDIGIGPYQNFFLAFGMLALFTQVRL